MQHQQRYDRRWLATALTLTMVLLACLAVASPAVAQELKTFESRNYTIHTDMPPDDIRPLAKHMDAVFNEYRRRFVASGIGRDRGRGKEDLYLFGTRAAYVSYMGTLGIQAENSGGMFFSRGNEAGLATWVYDKPRKETIQTLQHEGFHQFAHRFIGPQLPLWANEGLAVYFEQARLVKGKFKIGVAEPHRIQAIRSGIDAGNNFPINDLIRINSNQWFANMSDRVRGPMQYVQSWSICHFLIHGNKGRYQKAFNQYLTLLGSGRESGKAFETAFQTKDYKALERLWIKYVQEELQPDPYSGTIDKLEFLAGGSLWLKRNGKELPADFDAFKAMLKQTGYRISYGGGHTVSAGDDAVFVYTDSKGKDMPFEYKLDTKTGLPTLSAKRAKPSATIKWIQVGEQMMYDISYR